MINQIEKNKSGIIDTTIYFNNVPTNPTSINVKTISSPNGTVILSSQIAIAGATVGNYTYTLADDYTATLGIYTVIWEYIISGETYEQTEYFEVVTTLSTGYITPTEIRAKSIYPQITDTVPTDAILQKYIDRATLVIDEYLGGSIGYSIYSEARRCVLDKVHNGIHVQLTNRPILNLTSCVLMQGPTNTLNLDVDYLRINKDAGYIEYFQDVSAPTLRICIFDPTKTQIIPVATVVYGAGYITIPDAIKMAATLIVEQLYKETNGDDQRLSRFKIDNIEETYTVIKSDENAIEKLGLSNATAILRLLNPYRQTFKNFCFAGPLG